MLENDSMNAEYVESAVLTLCLCGVLQKFSQPGPSMKPKYFLAKYKYLCCKIEQIYSKLQILATWSELLLKPERFRLVQI